MLPRCVPKVKTEWIESLENPDLKAAAALPRRKCNLLCLATFGNHSSKMLIIHRARSMRYPHWFICILELMAHHWHSYTCTPQHAVFGIFRHFFSCEKPNKYSTMSSVVCCTDTHNYITHEETVGTKPLVPCYNQRVFSEFWCLQLWKTSQSWHPINLSQQ